MADAFDLVVAQLDVLGIDALQIERRELGVIVQDHDAADVVEAAVVLLHPGRETHQLLFVETLVDRDDAARPRAMRVQHRMRADEDALGTRLLVHQHQRQRDAR